MKKVIAIIVLAIVFTSCDGKKKENPEATKTESNSSEELFDKSEPVIVAEFKKGADLIAANDCLACHKVDEKVVGPSYQEVAAKYTQADAQTLVTKIIEGGTGVWGEVPMTAHPTVSKEDGLEMVNYILSLKQ
jgi:cytochrome c